MNTSVKNKTKSRRAYVPTTALAKELTFDEVMMHTHLTDGRIISVPLIWFPILFDATPEQRVNYEIEIGGLALYWPEIDEDISVATLLAGADRQFT